MPSTLLLFTRFFVTVSITFLLLLSSVQAEARSITLMNVSYDPTREFYRDYNEYMFTAAFAVSSILTGLALVTIAVKSFVEWYEQRSDETLSTH